MSNDPTRLPEEEAYDKLVQFERLCDIIRIKTGLRLQDTVSQKLKKVFVDKVDAKAFKVFVDEYENLEADSYEFLSVIENVINSETFFFRYPKQFKILENQLLDDVWNDNNDDQGYHKIRLMSAGCSLGSEAYSLAISGYRFYAKKYNLDYKEIFQNTEAVNLSPEVQRIEFLLTVDGYDIAPIHIKSAAEAIYDILNTEASRDKFKDHELFLPQVSTENKSLLSQHIAHPLLRSVSHFARANLRDSIIFARQYHIIFCRNVLMYNDKISAVKIIKNLIKGLKTGGYIVFAPTDFPPAEALDELEPFDAIQKIYRKVND